jgi:hypothetical protein
MDDITTTLPRGRGRPRIPIDKPRKGPGSGSRLRLWICECVPPVRLRVARDDLEARCLCCHTNFLKA